MAVLTEMFLSTERFMEEICIVPRRLKSGCDARPVSARGLKGNQKPETPSAPPETTCAGHCPSAWGRRREEVQKFDCLYNIF